MKVDLLPADRLTGELVARWDQIACAVPELASPYFRPEFIQAVAAVRRNVEVGVIRDSNSVVGFFPFERVSGCVARPVGGRLSDYQAVIASQEAPWSVADLMHACRLQAWEFDHHLVSQQQLEPYFTQTAYSWRIDTSAGLDRYIADRKAAGANALDTRLRKLRKLQREHDLRFYWNITDETVFDQLLAWKSDQYRRTELTNLFSFPWIVTLLKNIWRTDAPQFRGVLSVLFADDKPAAIHFGMQSGTHLHYWFPAYDASIAKHSPGSALLLLMIDQAHQHGVDLIDLGKGDDDYKLTFATEKMPLAEGIIETRKVTAAFRRGWHLTRDFLRRSRFREHAQTPIRWLRRIREWLALQ